MKKIIGVLAVSLIFTTLGCNNPGSSNRKYNDHFKEYTFKGTLNQEERTKLEAGLQKSALTVSSVKAKNESYTKNGFTERSQTSEGTLKICEDPSNKNLFVSSTSYTSNSSSKENGITLKQNNRTQMLLSNRLIRQSIRKQKSNVAFLFLPHQLITSITMEHIQLLTVKCQKMSPLYSGAMEQKSM